MPWMHRWWDHWISNSCSSKWYQYSKSSLDMRTTWMLPLQPLLTHLLRRFICPADKHWHNRWCARQSMRLLMSHPLFSPHRHQHLLLCLLESNHCQCHCHRRCQHWMYMDHHHKSAYHRVEWSHRHRLYRYHQHCLWRRYLRQRWCWHKHQRLIFP